MMAKQRVKNWTEFCKDCGGCCGLFPFEKSLFLKYQRLSQKSYTPIEVDEWIIPITSDGYCVFLTQKKRCVIYNDRPKICRLYGVMPELLCTKLTGRKTDLLAEYFSSQDLIDKYTSLCGKDAHDGED